jgi:hypothetical protein
LGSKTPLRPHKFPDKSLVPDINYIVVSSFDLHWDLLKGGNHRYHTHKALRRKNKEKERVGVRVWVQSKDSKRKAESDTGNIRESP